MYIYIHMYKSHFNISPLVQEDYALLLTPLSFLLVYRLNRSAVRFYDARAAAGKLIESCRVLAGEVVRFGHHDPGGEGSRKCVLGWANCKTIKHWWLGDGIHITYKHGDDWWFMIVLPTRTRFMGAVLAINHSLTVISSPSVIRLKKIITYFQQLVLCGWGCGHVAVTLWG